MSTPITPACANDLVTALFNSGSPPGAAMIRRTRLGLEVWSSEIPPEQVPAQDPDSTEMTGDGQDHRQESDHSFGCIAGDVERRTTPPVRQLGGDPGEQKWRQVRACDDQPHHQGRVREVKEQVRTDDGGHAQPERLYEIGPDVELTDSGVLIEKSPITRLSATSAW